MLRWMLLGLIICLWCPVMADREHEEKPDSFFTVPYNIHSIDDTVTDQQCRQVLDRKIKYTIKDNQSLYKNNDPSIDSEEYTRQTTTYISQSQRLFTGVYQFDKKESDNTKKQYAVQVAFLLNLKTKSIRGSMYLPGLCRANFIGLQENLDFWYHD